MGIEAEPIFSISIACECAGVEGSDGITRITPAVEEKEACAVRIEEQMVEPMLRTGQEGALFLPFVRKSGGIRKVEKQRLPAGGEVDFPNPCTVRCVYVAIGVGDTSVTVAGSAIIKSSKIRSDGGFAIGAQCVDRMRQDALLPSAYIEDMGDKFVADAIVPDNVCL